MKKISQILAAATVVFAVGCTPKTGGKMTDTKPTSTAPKIEIPGGDVRQKAPQAGAAPTINIGKAETFVLDNGLKVIVVENHKLPHVSFQIFVDADPVLEKEAAGYSEVMGELLAKGTTTRTKDQIDEEVDFIGASMYSSENGVVGACLSRHADKLLGLMSDVLLNPTFPEAELKKSKTRRASTLAQAKDNADQIAANVAAVLNYGKNHPYGEFMTEATLEKINLELIKNYYKLYFKPNISYFVVVGDMTKAQAEKYAKKYFGGWQRGEAPTHKYDEPKMPEKAQVVFVNKPGAVQSVVNITHPASLRPGAADGIAARLMNTILGGYFNSRVNANLREGHAYTYGARTALSPNKLGGSFTANASVRNEVTDSSVTQFLYELSKMRDTKVPAKELSLVKNVLTGQFAMSLEDPETVAEFALSTARYGLAADYHEKYLTRLNSMTDAEIMEMAKKYVHPERSYILVVGNKEQVAKKLAQFSPEKEVKFYDTYGNPIQEIGKIPAGVTGETVVADYLNALGGVEKLAAIQNVVSTVSLKTGGPEFKLKTWQHASSKFAMEMSMNGQVMTKQIWDGKKGKEIGMGGAGRMMEEGELGDLKENAVPFKELKYKELGYKLVLKGAENLNGKNAYVVEVTRPDGQVRTEYYDMKTSLKIREQTTQEQDGEKTTVLTDLDDYRAVNGVMFPHKTVLAGLFPVPLNGEVVELKVNAAIEEAVFEIK